MATGFHLSIGYSGLMNIDERQEAWEIMSEYALGLIYNEDTKIVLQLPITDEERQMIYRAFSYYSDSSQAYFTILESQQEIMLMASGGGDWRKIKELAALNFCHQVAQYMASLGIPVSIKIA